MLTLTKIFEHARLQPTKTALVHDGQVLSYAELARRIASTRRFLAAQSLPPAGVAIIAAANLLDDWLLIFALRGLGLSTVTARTLVDMQTLDIPDAVCVLRSFADDQQAEACPSGFPWRWLPVPRTALDGADALSDADYAAAALPLHAPAAGHIVRTSGTTGVHKKVMRDVAAETMGMLPTAQVYQLSNDSVVYLADYQLWTASGYRWGVMVWTLGGTVVLQSSSDLWQPLADHSFSHMLMTPDKLAELLRTPRATPRDQQGMKLMTTGGALSQALLADAQRVLTPQVFSMLGSTEASIFCVTLLQQPQDLLSHHIHPAREVQVVDADDQPLAPGQEGHLRVRITDGLSGYLGDEVATREHFRDGWFYPGDLVVQDADGRIRLQGRSSDVVNVRGNKVSTGRIEQALCERLQVSAVCILALPNAELEDELHLFIETPQALPGDRVAAAVEAEFGRLRALPLNVRFASRLPRNDMGKVPRPQLRQMLMAALARKA